MSLALVLADSASTDILVTAFGFSGGTFYDVIMSKS